MLVREGPYAKPLGSLAAGYVCRTWEPSNALCWRHKQTYGDISMSELNMMPPQSVAAAVRAISGGRVPARAMGPGQVGGHGLWAHGIIRGRRNCAPRGGEPITETPRSVPSGWLDPTIFAGYEVVSPEHRGDKYASSEPTHACDVPGERHCCRRTYSRACRGRGHRRNDRNDGARSRWFGPPC